MVTGKMEMGDRSNIISVPLRSSRPDHITDEQDRELKGKADKAILDLKNSEGSDTFDVEERISNVGVQDQRATSSSLALLQERMGSVFYSENKASASENLTKNIATLQGALARVNPRDIQTEAKFRIIRLIPFFGNWIVKVLKESANRRITLQEFIDHLEESLEHGQLMLRQDNAQLKVMYSDLEKKQKLVTADAYLAELLIERLAKLVKESPEDDKRKASYNRILFKVATRAQDLRAMENAHEQFFASIEMTRDNNDMLVATVERMLTLGMQVVYVAFAIHAALMRQKDVIAAERGTREFLGNMILTNATMINNHVAEIGDLYKQPVIAMDKLEASIHQLEMAIDSTNKLNAEGITVARANIEKIKKLTEEVKDKVGELPSTKLISLEASDTLKLSSGE
jgi:uncharacterized protein YaaN involved in tellurite resistance